MTTHSEPHRDQNPVTVEEEAKHEVTLDLAIPIDPRTASKLKLKRTVIDHENRVVVLYYAPIDENGVELETRNVEIAGPDPHAWILSQEDGFVAFLLAAHGASKKK